MKKKEGGVEEVGGTEKQGRILLLPESLATVQNMLLVPARSRKAGVPEQPLPMALQGLRGSGEGTRSERGWQGWGWALI